MSLRRKVLIVIIAAFATVAAVLYVAARTIMMREFEIIERDRVRRNVGRAVDAVGEQISKVDYIARDWGAWDETYEFINDKNPEYIKSNINEATLSGLKVNFILYVNLKGEVVYGAGFDEAEEKVLPLDPNVRDIVDPLGPLVRKAGDTEGIAGIMLMKDGSAVIASRPILTGEAKGPVRGSMVMGKYLGKDELDELSRITHLTLKIEPYNEASLPMLKKEKDAFIEPVNDEVIAGYTYLKDIFGKPALMIEVELPREIHLQGLRSIRYFLFGLLGTGLIIGVATIFILDRMLLSRLENIGRDIDTISATGDFSGRVGEAGKDELTALSKHINHMLSSLESAKENLSKSEERFKGLIENALDLIGVIDVDGTIRYLSPSSEEMIGYRPDELVGKSCFELFSPTDVSSIATLLDGLSHAPTNTRSAEYRFRHKDGSQRVLEGKSKAMIVDGKAEGVILNLRDMTARKKFEEELYESERRLKTILHSMQFGIMIVDAETHKIVDVNAAASLIIGTKPENIIGTVCHKFVCPAELGKCPVTDLGMKIESSEKVLLRADGAELPILKTVVPITLGGRKHLIESFVDISARKRAEEKLKSANDELVRLGQVKSDFISMVSHELRTPLTAIKEGIDIVLEGIDGPVTEDQKTTLGISKKNVDRLGRLINDVLDLTKIEAGKMEMRMTRTNVNDAVGEIYNFMKPVILKKDIKFTLRLPDEPVTAYFDPDRMRQVIVNLLNNSSKFTKAGGSIGLGLSHTGHLVKIEIEDTGIGIKPEDQEKIFEAFSQVPQEGELRTAGTGLGLAICRHIADHHRGNLAVESEYGKGSKFIITFPDNLDELEKA